MSDNLCTSQRKLEEEEEEEELGYGDDMDDFHNQCSHHQCLWVHPDGMLACPTMVTDGVRNMFCKFHRDKCHGGTSV